MKKLWIIVVIIAVVVLGVLWTQFKSKTQTLTEPIKIGFVGPFTGPSAFFGDMMQNGLDIALNQLSIEDKSKIQIIKEDDLCNAKTGLSAISKLINIDKVKYVIGPLCNESSAATEKIFEYNKVISISIGLPSKQIANMGPYHFSFSPEIDLMMKTIANKISLDGNGKVGVIYINSVFQKENHDRFMEHLLENNLKVVADESALTGSSDFRTQLIKIKEAKPDSLMLIAHTADLVNILKQLNDTGLSHLPKYGIHAAESGALTKNNDGLAEGLIYPYPASRDEILSAKSFYDEYKKLYQTDSNPYSSNAFDSLNILVLSIKQCGYDNTDCVQNKLATLRNYLGANGSLTVDSRGVGTYEKIMLKVVKDNKFVKLK